MELKKPCAECPLANELLVSENTPQFSSMSELLVGLTNDEYTLSCHKYTECGVIGEKEQTDDPPLCKGALLLKESIARDFYFSDPKRWNEREWWKDRGLYPVDISWVDDGDGPKKLSTPVRCF